MQGKKSFVLYCDIQHTIKHLSDEQAGKLFKHLLSYVNDENPMLTDPILSIAFEPIKQNLKRDLEKWQTTRQKRAAAGRKGGQAKQANARNANQSEASQAVIVNDNDNVIVNDNVTAILQHFNKCFSKKARIIPKTVRDMYNDLIKEGYEVDDIMRAMTGAASDKWHKERNYEVCTLKFFGKVETIDRYANLSVKTKKYIPTK